MGIKSWYRKGKAKASGAADGEKKEGDDSSSSAASTGKVLKEGILTKKGKVNPAPKERYFKIHDTGLVEYFEVKEKVDKEGEVEKEYNKKGSFSLIEDGKAAEISVDASNEAMPIIVKAGKRDWVLTVDQSLMPDAQDTARDEWTLAMKLAAANPPEGEQNVKGVRYAAKDEWFLHNTDRVYWKDIKTLAMMGTVIAIETHDGQKFEIDQDFDDAKAKEYKAQLATMVTYGKALKASFTKQVVKDLAGSVGLSTKEFLLLMKNDAIVVAAGAKYVPGARKRLAHIASDEFEAEWKALRPADFKSFGLKDYKCERLPDTKKMSEDATDEELTKAANKLLDKHLQAIIIDGFISASKMDSWASNKDLVFPDPPMDADKKEKGGMFVNKFLKTWALGVGKAGVEIVKRWQEKKTDGAKKDSTSIETLVNAWDFEDAGLMLRDNECVIKKWREVCNREWFDKEFDEVVTKAISSDLKGLKLAYIALTKAGVFVSEEAAAAGDKKDDDKKDDDKKDEAADSGDKKKDDDEMKGWLMDQVYASLTRMVQSREDQVRRFAKEAPRDHAQEREGRNEQHAANRKKDQEERAVKKAERDAANAVAEAAADAKRAKIQELQAAYALAVTNGETDKAEQIKEDMKAARG